MSEKKPLTDELLREIVPQLNDYEDYSINYDETHLLIEFEDRDDAERLAQDIDGAGIFECTVSLDLYRLSAMGRKWAIGQGASFVISTIDNMSPHLMVGYGNGTTESEIFQWRDKPAPKNYHDNLYSDELSATFAAISAVWERVKG